MIKPPEWKPLGYGTLLFCSIFLMFVLPALSQEPPPAKVKITRATEQEARQTTEFVGTLYFDKISSVSTEVSGMAESVHFREGDRVKKGDLLLRLNTDFLKKDLALEKTELQRLDIRIEQKQKNLKRFETLFEQEAASETDYEDFLFSYRELVKEKQSLQIKIDRIQLEIAKSVIRAPFDGLILQKQADRGAWIQPGTPICQIAAMDDVFIQLPVAENLLRHVSDGDRIDLVINAFNESMTGTVEGIRPIADEKTKNVFLKIRLPEMDTVFKNMSATVQMPTSEKMSLRLIPRDALVKFQGKDFAYTVKDHKAKILPLNIVTLTGKYIGVDNPYIQPGMPIVVEGNERLKPDQPVEIVGEK
jgi:RND family efflux transporter MFP subunit